MVYLHLALMVLTRMVLYTIADPTGAILVSNDHPRCKDVNIHTQRLVCEIHSQEDEMKIEGFGLSGCYGSTLSCAEGDIKTCMPLMTINTLHYQCFCHADEEGSSTVNYNYYWTQWQERDKHFRGFRYNRKLMIDNEMDHLAEEFSLYPDILYIVANYSLPDSVYSASSQLNLDHGIIRARIDNYFAQPCTWTAHTSDSYPWLKISLPNEYTIIGVYIKRRCDDYVQYPTVVDVMTSDDDVIWQDVVVRDDIASRYSSDDGQGFVKIWFPNLYTTKYWKIYIFEFVGYNSMKCDLLGY